MDGKEAIIKRITLDAENKAKGIIDNAEKESNERIKDATDWAEEYISSHKKLLDKDCADVVSRRQTVAELDTRKLLLKAKQEVISGVLDNAYNSLCTLEKSKYAKLVEKLISEYADNGDELILSSDGILSETDVKKMGCFNDKKLTVCSKKGDFVGGVKLVGKVCDKDLSFSSLIYSKKDEFVSKVAQIIFND